VWNKYVRTEAAGDESLTSKEDNMTLIHSKDSEVNSLPGIGNNSSEDDS
jgi:hypothetical protein